LKQIAIDEIAVGRGHKYLIVVLNLKTGVVVFVGDGKYTSIFIVCRYNKPDLKWQSSV